MTSATSLRFRLPRAAAAASLVVLAAACAALNRSAAAPHIDSVKPDSVTLSQGAVVEVIVRGSGFAPGAPGRNIVRFGEVKLTDVPASADGREIRLVVPERLPSRGDAAPLPLESGRYDVTVETPSGTSNAVSVRVDR